MTDNQIVKAWGAGARIKDDVLQERVASDIRRDIEYGTVGDAIKFLSGLDPEASLDIYPEMAYGDETVIIEVTEWVNVGPNRKAEMVKTIQTRKQQNQDRDEREFRRLQAARPDLFK